MGYVSRARDSADVNIIPIRNVYPGAPGGTLGTLASASSPDSNMYDVPTPADPGAAVSAPAAPGARGNGLAWWTGIAIIVGLILFAAKKTGDAGDFSNLRASTYNIGLVTLIAVLGITFLKIVAVKVENVPGLGGFSTVVKAV
jgi:hypothetical protein